MIDDKSCRDNQNIILKQSALNENQTKQTTGKGKEEKQKYKNIVIKWKMCIMNIKEVK